jgi:large subunit ribosomal protein L15
MELHNLKKVKINKGRKRVGRGIGSGKGGHTVGKGQKGQKSRKGAKPNLGFEGGQTPLYKKLPKIGGFKNATKKEVHSVNLDIFNSFKDGEEVTPESLLKNKVIKNIPSGGIKILSDGELNKKLEFKGFEFSKKAKDKIESSGSKINA